VIQTTATEGAVKKVCQKFGQTDDGSSAPKRLRADPAVRWTLGRPHLIFSGCKGSNGTMKTWPRPRTVPLLLRVCYWFCCRKVRMQKSLAIECNRSCTRPGSGSSSLTVESFLRESGSVASQGGSSPGTLRGALKNSKRPLQSL